MQLRLEDDEIMIRTLLVDDEELARSTLRRALATAPEFDGFEIVGEAANGVEALEAIDEYRPDLVFLDIEMPGFGGFEVVQQLSNAPVIVFVTAWDEYAVRAFEANALDYLLKPVQPDRLQRALVRIRQRFDTRTAGWSREQDAHIAEIVARRSEPLKRLAARRGKRIVIVPLREIVRIEIEDKLVFACTTKERLLVEKSIAELENLLQPAGFLRISRGELVNLEMVKELAPYFSGTWRVKLANGEERDVSRERAKQLKEAMGVG
jgi:two-component system, LytTR family, response regulator